MNYRKYTQPSGWDQGFHWNKGVMWIPVVLLAATNLLGQTQVDLQTQSKRVDFTQATTTSPVKTGTILPGTCKVGELFYVTAAAAGRNLYGCTAADTWSLQGDGGSGGGGGGAVGGSNTQVQFNDAGVANGTAGLTFNKSSEILSVVGGVVSGSNPPLCTAGTAGVICMKEGTPPPGEAAAAILYPKTDHLLYANLSNGGEDQVLTADGVKVLTNTTIDTAAAGNSLKVNGTVITGVSGTGAICLASGSACGGGSRSVTLPLGLCTGAAAVISGNRWAADSGSPGAESCAGGADASFSTSYSSLADGSSSGYRTGILIPDDWDNSRAVSLHVHWSSTSAGGNVEWGISTSCLTPGTSVASTASYNTEQTTDAAESGTVGGLVDTVFSTVTMTGCHAGDILRLKELRKGSAGGDTSTGSARFMGGSIKFQVTGL